MTQELVYFGVDVGQTKSHLILEVDNQIISETVLDGLTHSDDDFFESFKKNISQFRQSKPISNLTAAIGFTFLPDQNIQKQIFEFLKNNFGASTLLICGDELSSHIGALGFNPGVVMAAGTGISCTSISPSIGFCAYGGHGYLLSDEGSGFWIGREGISAALKAKDGIGPETKLTEKIESMYGSMKNITNKVYLSHRPSKEVASVAQDVFSLSDTDEVASSICSRAINELSNQVIQALRLSKSTRFTLTGGLMQNISLKNAIKSQVLTTLPEVVFHEPIGTAAHGCIELSKNISRLIELNSSWQKKVEFSLFQ